jgi:hypothetical protein
VFGSRIDPHLFLGRAALVLRSVHSARDQADSKVQDPATLGFQEKIGKAHSDSLCMKANDAARCHSPALGQ